MTVLAVEESNKGFFNFFNFDFVRKILVSYRIRGTLVGINYIRASVTIDTKSIDWLYFSLEHVLLT